MTKLQITAGVAHSMPTDFRNALIASPRALIAWESITPLARNEWICWVVTVKTRGTRENHIARTITELSAGKRRPCCWVGCIHRADKALSASQKFIIRRQSKAK